mgnify:CR=1 FL=1
MSSPRPACGIGDELVPISGQQVDIPCERHVESGRSLIVRAGAMLEAAIGPAESAGDPAVLAETLAHLARVHMRNGDAHQAVAAADRALAIAEPLDADAVIAEALLNKASVLGQVGRWRESSALGETALRMAIEGPDRSFELRTRNNLASGLAEVDPARAAEMFVEAQSPEGRWQGSSLDEAAETAFAVLFLRRRFQKISAPVTAERTIVLDALGPQSTAEAVTACVDGLVRRGKSAVPDILAALRGDVVNRRRAAVRALATIAAVDFGIDPEAEAKANELALRRAELWYLKNR